MPDHTTPDRHRDHTVSLSLYAKVCLSKCFPWYEQLLHNVHWAKNVDQQLAAAEHVDDALKTEGVQIGEEWKESICVA